jgi:hypothetical protein
MRDFHLCGECGYYDDEDGVVICTTCKEDKEEEEEEEGCGCGVCSRCVADDTCAAQCGDKGTITVVGKDGTNSLVCKDCCAWFKTQNEEAHKPKTLQSFLTSDRFAELAEGAEREWQEQLAEIAEGRK